MKLNEVKKVGFYTTNLAKRETLYEVIKDKEILLIDTWTYDYTDADDRKHYECDGSMYSVEFADEIEVFEVKDTNYNVSGSSGSHLTESKPTYKEKFNMLLKGDKETIKDLEKILPMIEFNTVAYDYLGKVIKDFKEDLRGER